MKRLFPLAFFFGLVLCLSAQQNDDPSSPNFINHIHAKYGTHDLLVNGPHYYQKNPLIHGSPYFMQDDWLKADLYIKGVLFREKKIKYDLVDDRLVMFSRNQAGIQRSLWMDNALIDSLQIKHHLFISLKDSTYRTINHHFGECIYSGKQKLIAIYHKFHLENHSSLYPYGKFTKVRRKLYLVNNSGTYDITKKRNLLKQYEFNKNQIRKYLRKNNISYKRANPEQLKKLLKYCDEL